MPRPTNKSDLIRLANTKFSLMWQIIDEIPQPAQVIFDFNGKEAHWRRDKNLRDIMIHLFEWHMLLLKFIDNNTEGSPQSFLPAPYNWRNYAELNQKFWLKHQSTSYIAACSLLKDSHQQVMAKIEAFSDSQLFVKRVFNWTGSVTLGSYFTSATSSHYDWAIKKLKAYQKLLKTC